MKKTLLLTLGLLFAMIVTAQNNIYLINEDFSGSGIPDGWTKSGNGVNNWYISPSFSAGGKVNELYLQWTPQFNGIARFVSPAIDLTGINNAMLSLDTYVSMFGTTNKAKIGVATSSDGGYTWNNVWSEEYTKTDQYPILCNISGPDMGKQNVNFCLYFEGNSYTISGIYFDNFQVYIVESLGIEISSIDVPKYIAQDRHTIDFTVKNVGETTIKSFEARCMINGEEKFSESFYTEMNYLDSKQFSFEDDYYFAFGEDHDIEIEIFRINDDDLDDSKDLTKTISVAFGETQRTPMIEHFSSSTCDPCVAVNTTMAELTDNNKGAYTYTKYTVNGPGLGDPYFTEEVGTKMTYYNVISVPMVFFDGTLIEKTSINDETFQKHYKTPALANVRGAFNVVGNTINITADFMTYFNVENIKAYVSVNEKTTTKNTGSNGETEFHHVMMKMLNDDKGTNLDIKAGEYKRLEFSYDMSNTNVEDINDLEVALWLQDDETKEIFNSHYAYEYTDHCYPVRNVTANKNGNNITVKWDNPEKGTPDYYIVFINGTSPSDYLTVSEYSTNYSDAKYIEVVAFYENGKSSIGVAKHLNSEENINEVETNNINIYPNPVNDRLYIETELGIEEVSVFDVFGRSIVAESQSHKVTKTSVDLSGLNTGIYFVKINTEKENIVKRIIKQ